MVLLYVSVCLIGSDTCEGNYEFSGETWDAAFASIVEWMRANRKPTHAYKIWC